MENKMKKKGPIVRYLMGSVYLTLLLVFINLLVYVVSYKGGVILSLGILIYVGSSFAIYLKQKPLILNEMAAFSSQYDKKSLRMTGSYFTEGAKQMPLPFFQSESSGSNKNKFRFPDPFGKFFIFGRTVAEFPDQITVAVIIDDKYLFRVGAERRSEVAGGLL